MHIVGVRQCGLQRRTNRRAEKRQIGDGLGVWGRRFVGVGWNRERWMQNCACKYKLFAEKMVDRSNKAGILKVFRLIEEEWQWNGSWEDF